MKTIDCYISLNSPWTYLGSKRLIDIAAARKATVNVRPVNVAELFPKTGSLPLPKRSPERKAYRMMELTRWRDHLGIPIKLEPAFFPADEIRGVGLLFAAREIGADALRLSSEIGNAVWERDEDMSQDAVLDDACERAGCDVNELRGTAAEMDVTALYAASTREAIAAGVFGVPMYKIDDELFWGQDRLDFVERALSR